MFRTQLSKETMSLEEIRARARKRQEQLAREREKAERERMHKRAESDAVRLAEDFNREMHAAYFNFQTGAETWKKSDWTEFNWK